ncbi:hypothetical protein GMOD_00009277 [Pyrenophora seminiperda CCB06]|uniref:Uncharacterized protein n=1 Tax=Pyrenophora seminiperda CCB06 TaxID=1302712 RepID=A0A3M7MBZ8_9PLEO|nr:hypothetical protein GMOD_00009277 [Pyrenophora seminiperda CCB06]
MDALNSTTSPKAVDDIAPPPRFNAPIPSTSSSPTTTLLHRDTNMNMNHTTISTSSAMGIGIVIGIIGNALVIAFVLFVHRRRTLHSTQRHRRQARLWKGFDQVTPNTARTSLMDNKMTTIYLTLLPTPVTPAFLPGSPLGKGVREKGKSRGEGKREEGIGDRGGNGGGGEIRRC